MQRSTSRQYCLSCWRFVSRQFLTTTTIRKIEDDVKIVLNFFVIYFSHSMFDVLEGVINILTGYARVSTINQHEDRQIQELIKYGVEEKDIYIDKQSGKDFKRPQYIRMIKHLKQGDILVLKSIDRLGRNYNEIQEEWKHITKKKGVDIVVIDMPLLDTTKNKDLLGTFIADLVLQVLSFFAENERINIRQRQAEGIEAAKKRGVKFGRPPISIPDNFEEIYLLWKNKKITTEQAASKCGFSVSTFYRLIQQMS